MLSAPLLAQDVGFEGPSFPVAVTTPTESKPESKLWFHDGFWWGCLWSANAYRIHRINFFNHAWVDTGAVIEGNESNNCVATACAVVAVTPPGLVAAAPTAVSL